MAKRAKKAVTRGKARRSVRLRLDLLDVAELKAAVDRRVSSLADERTQLLARLADVNAQLAALGASAAVAAPARKVKTAGKTGRDPGKTRGPRQGKTLGNTLVSILESATEPMRVKDLVKAVRNSNYGSRSPHLRSMVNQALSKDDRFRKVRRGLYRVA
ncbi:MAG: hypothetical protein PHU85_18610 [Phycisphaerae bacterium]|nr:hypothetical protein [Phycisphaerae bacterium]